MSGLIVRVGVAVICAGWVTSVVAAEPVVPVADPSAAHLAAALAAVGAAPAPVTVAAQPPDGALPAPVASQTTPATAVPLPPGVFVGLFGLASAAVARRRYLRRH